MLYRIFSHPVWPSLSNNESTFNVYISVPVEEKPSSPDVVILPPRNDLPKRKQKKLIPGVIWIKPEPGTSDVSEQIS